MPNEPGAVPILRSTDDRNGLVFTWSIWLYVDSLGHNNKAYKHIFHKGSAKINDDEGPPVSKTLKSTVSTAADGGKFALDAAAGTVGGAVDALGGKRVQEGSKRTLKQIDNAGQRDRKNRARPPPEPDSATSNTQGEPKIRGKGGFCFIGEQENVRSCMRVNDPSQCMSGDIFPTQAICVNPSLRQ